MFVLVRRPAGSVEVTLQEPDDLSRLHLLICDVDWEVAAAALVDSGTGYFADEPGKAWLSTSFLRDSGPPPSPGAGSDRPERWDRMMAYAAGQGWVHETGEFVRAHVIFGAPTGAN